MRIFAFAQSLIYSLHFGTGLEEIETKMMIYEAAAGKQNHDRAIGEQAITENLPSEIWFCLAS